MSALCPVFGIEGEFSIYRAAELGQALQAWLSGQQPGGRIALDLSAVSDMDSAGLQLLLSLQCSAQAQAMPWTITSASPAVQEVLGLAGLQHWLAPASAQ